jgi:hypothetical protein
MVLKMALIQTAYLLGIALQAAPDKDSEGFP